MFKKEFGFTLVEMLIVLMIIAVLILLIVPTIAKRGDKVDDQGCEALISTVQSQADAYRLEHKEYPSSVSVLKDEDFITEKQMTCRNGEELTIDGKGIVGTKK